MTDYTQPTEEFLRSIDIKTLLPQKAPFVMVGTLTYFEMRRTVTEFLVTQDNLFVRDGRLSAAGLVENMAQTCATRLGYVNKYILKKGIQIGYIGAIKNMQIDELPKVGQTITTQVDIREEVFGMLLADASVTSGGKLLASAQMKIAEKDS